MASAEIHNDLGGVKFALGAALELGSLNKTWVTAGLEVPLGNFTIGALQKLGLGSTNGETTLSLDYAFSKHFGIRFSDTLIFVNGFGGVNQRVNFGLRGSFSNAELLRTLLGNEPQTVEPFGTTNIAASYDLPAADGQAGRARAGIDTELPLGSNLSAQVGAEFRVIGQTEASFNLGLLYNSEGSKASARGQFSILPGGLKQVYTAAGLFK